MPGQVRGEAQDTEDITGLHLREMPGFVQEKVQKSQENQGFLLFFGRKGLAFCEKLCYSNIR